MDTRSTIQSIQENWSIPRTHVDAEILPSALLAGIPFSHLKPELQAAIHTLSTLTVGQRDRAHKLLTTYFYARMREAKCSSQPRTNFAMVELSDVENAIKSARKLSLPTELQGILPVAKQPAVVPDDRNYSIKHELPLPQTPPPSKAQDQTTTASSAETSAQPDPTTATQQLPTLPTTTPQTDSYFTHALTPPLTPHTQKRRSRLAPIRTSSLAPTKHGNVHNKRIYYALAGADAKLRALHEFNTRKLELRAKRREVEVARWRCEEARSWVERMGL